MQDESSVAHASCRPSHPCTGAAAGGECAATHGGRNRIPVYPSLAEARMIHLGAAADEARCVNRRRVGSRSKVMRERSHPVPRTTDR